MELDRISSLKRQVQYLNERISETEKTIKYTNEKLKEDIPIGEIVRQIEKLFPYELNYQKPMTQLFSETPTDLQIWELTDGNKMRIQLLWKNYLALIKSQLGLLQNEKN